MGKNVRLLLNSHAITGTVKFVAKPDILPTCLDKDDDFLEVQLTGRSLYDEEVTTYVDLQEVQAVMVVADPVMPMYYWREDKGTWTLYSRHPLQTEAEPNGLIAKLLSVPGVEHVGDLDRYEVDLDLASLAKPEVVCNQVEQVVRDWAGDNQRAEELHKGMIDTWAGYGEEMNPQSLNPQSALFQSALARMMRMPSIQGSMTGRTSSARPCVHG